MGSLNAMALGENGAEMEQLVETCFDPKPPYYRRMKESVLQMFAEKADE